MNPGASRFVWVFALLGAWTACGRVGFESITGASGDGGGGDGGGTTDGLVATGSPSSPFSLEVDHTCYIAGGALLCWGGVFGLAPTEIAGGDWIEISGGEAHRCGIRAGGSLFCWGENFEGGLGTGDLASTSSPAPVDSALSWRQVGAARFSTCAITTAGELYCWGRNDDGALGLGDTMDRLSPERVGTHSDWTRVCSGGNHFCAMRADQSMWCWGSNESGQIGIGSTMPRFPSLQSVAGSWTEAFCGKEHTCAIRDDGTLWCWGQNLMGQLGLGDSGASNGRLTPEPVGSESDWSQLGGGRFVTCGLRGSTLYCWGDNTNDAVGVPGQTLYNTARQVDARAWRVIGRSNGEQSCAEAADGSVWCWGLNSAGQLGTGDMTNRDAPFQVLAGP